MRLSLKQQLMILIGVVTALTVAVAVAIIIPAVRTILELERDINQLQAFLEQQYQKTQQLRRSAQAVDELLLQIKPLDGATMKNGDELRMIKRLEGLAAAHRIDQTLVVNFTEVPPAPLLVEAKSLALNQSHYTFSFLNHGRFDDHLQFLRALEAFPEYFVIRELHWEKRQHNPGAAAPITMRFDAVVYVWPSS